MHGSILGEGDSYLGKGHEAVDGENHALVGQRGVAGGGAYALIVVPQEAVPALWLTGGISPVAAAHLLVQPLGGGLDDAVGD